MTERTASDPAAGASLTALAMASVARVPDRPALVAAGRMLSYAELAAVAASLARTLGRHDPAPDVGRAALLAYRSVAAYAGVLGILLAGKAYVPLNPRFPTERTRAMLEAADTRVLVVDRRSADAAFRVLATVDRPMLVLMPEHEAPPTGLPRSSRHRIVCRDEFEAGDGPPPAPAAASEDGAYLLFTSGSTGRPKGVLVTHANATTYVRNVRSLFTPTERDRFSQAFDLTFDLSVHDLFVCWSVGACLCVVPEEALIGPASFIRDQGITCWFSVPSTVAFMHRFGMLEPGSLPSVRSSLFCGEALPGSLAAAWKAAAPDGVLLNLYGPTEATVAITAAPWRSPEDDGPGGVAAIGRPFPGQRVAVVDDALRPVPPGDIGELCLAGPQLAPGYWRDPVLTAERFVALPGETGPDNRWYRTGDLASWRADLGLVFHGRSDHQIKIRGHRVEIGEVEDALRAAAGSSQAAAVGWPRDPTGGTLGIVAFVAGTASDPAAILSACRARLPDYMLPAAIHVLDALPLNVNGKVDRAALVRRLEGGA